MEETTGGICGQDGCGETHYHLENGLWFCQQGHQQEGRQVVTDDDDFGTRGKTSRKKTIVQERVSKIYHGFQAYQLFLEAYQLILWKQCFTLIKDKGLPSKLEGIVKDLWALRLQKLYGKGEDPSLFGDAVLWFSSQAETSSGTDEDDRRYNTKRASDFPGLIDSLGLCYLGILLLRIPLGLGCIYSWAVTDEIPFIRVIQFIPQDIKERLPAVYHSALDTQSVPTGDQLHRAVANLVILYHREFGILFPPINSPLLLLGYLKQLALPLEIFPAVNRLQKLIGFTYSFPQSVRGRFRRIYLPEAQLVALLVTVTKLFYPFDDVERYPSSWQEPTTQVVDWGNWATAQRKFDDERKEGRSLGKGDEVKIKEVDVFDMSSRQLDEYMDWYQKMWIGNKVSNPLTDMFPTTRICSDGVCSSGGTQAKDDDEDILQKLQTVLSQQKARRAVSDEESLEIGKPVPRPGSFYERCQSESQLSERAKLFYEAAARVVGVSLRTLVMVVSQTEHKLQLWEERIRGRNSRVKSPATEPVMGEEVVIEYDSRAMEQR